MMSEYWLISAPGEKTCQQTFDTMNNLTNKQNNLCNNYKFHIPDLKVGTLDQLVGLSDDLGKLDTYVEQITRKVAGYLGEVLEDQRDKLHENLLANNSPGPGPPDDTHTHSELTGKASNLSNSRDTTTTTISATISTCSACHTTATNTTSGSSNNDFSTTELSERDYDYLASAASPVCCHCVECAAANAVCHSPNTTTTNTSPLSTGPSASATATTLAADDACCHQHHQQQQPHHPHSHQQHTSHMLPSSSVSPPPPQPSSANQVFSSVARAAAAAAAACAMSSVNATPSNNKYALDGNGSYLARSAPVTSKMNNNTCCINNNKWSDSFSNSCHINPHYHNHNHPQQQQLHQQPHHVQLPNLHSHHSEEIDGVPAAAAAGVMYGGCGRGRGSCDANASSNLRSSNSTSDVSDTFDWWFYKRKRNSKKSSSRSSSLTSTRTTATPSSSTTSRIFQFKYNGSYLTSTHRSSPVSSCCGSSSHGRSSPDTEIGEPPAFPLSPAELSVYITRFQWDMAKYPIKQSLRNIADIISKQIGQIDADLKTKSGAYNNLKGSLQNLEKKQTGSLLTRNLADLVKKEHFILDSEYLTTLLVIVPKMSANDWMANYEKITDMIVPRSSTMITQDNDYCLFNVTLFKKVVEEFKLHAREKKFIVRDFVYNEEELAAGKNEITKLITDKKKQFGPLVRWLKVNFSESFCALVHVKALRVFVESVLRYGLPVNFQAILIEPNKKSVKRLRDSLNQLYGHLDGASAAGQGSNSDNVDIPGLGFGQSEYFPYVFYKLNIDMVETAKI